MICRIWKRLSKLNSFHSYISVTAFGRHYLHHYSPYSHLSDLFIGVVSLILFDVDILHFNMLKGGIPAGFQWALLVFTDVTQYQQFFV